MAEIFISYAQSDKDKVRPIARALEAEGFDVFWDPEIPPGETWDNIIARELKSARCVIVAWSERSAESDWVKEEAEYGKQKKALVPVQIDGAGPPLGFTRLQTANLSGWSGDTSNSEWQKVIARVRHHGVDTSAARSEPAPEREAGRLHAALYDAPSERRDGATTGPAAVPAGASGFAAAEPQRAYATPSTAPPEVAPTGFDFGYIFFKPSGRLGKKAYWQGLGLMAAVLLPTTFIIGFLSWILLFYPSICLYGKRLHDAGKSVWIYVVFTIINAVVSSLTFAILLESGIFWSWEEPLGFGIILGLFANIAFSVWAGLAASEPRTNRHGPPPGGPSVSADVFA